VGGCGAGSSGVNAGAGRGLDLPPSPYAVKRCRLDVVLEPAGHRLEATATLTIALRKGTSRGVAGELYLELNQALGIDEVTCAGSPVSFRRLPIPKQPPEEESDDDSDEGPPLDVYRLDWPAAGAPGGELVIRYGGRLFQDVQAGEKPGEIHNFQMRAHVGTEGVYLGESGAWYPRIAESDDDDEDPEREAPLTQFEVTATEVPGMVLVACGNREGAKLDAPRGERTTWRSPFPLQGMALVGGPHKVFQRQVDDVLVSVHVSEDHASFAPGILDAVESYLRLYEPLIGAYPYDEFTVVENFFSSGFAFPGFTVLASAVIGMGEDGLRPGYQDHELVHNWWGNGVFVSALDGNWCECLTSYCTNYMRHILEGRHAKARAYRRSTSYALSRLPLEKDKPLGNYGRDDGPSRWIGYQKGAFVFAMLAEKVGTDTLWRALRRLYEERLGKPTGWDGIRQIVEKESGQPLAAFFEQWVRGSGMPEIVIDEARYDQRARRLTITLLQEGDRVFDVSVPIRLVYDDGIIDKTVDASRPAQAAIIKSLMAPKFVELDPDFRVLRRVPLGDVMPTISGVSKSKSLLIVRSEDDGEAYGAVADRLTDRYKKAEDTTVREVKDTELKAEDLKQGHVLLLGRACLTPAAGEILKGTPLSIADGHFSVEKQHYDQPGHEVLCCVRNELDPGGVICLYYGNSAKDLRKAGVLTFYGGNSLVVFEDGKVALRRDFESSQRVVVKTGS
jgi:hypothetical protein